MNATNTLIKIENCNNISSCDLGIVQDILNIKYAINGTGKSTIAKALKFAAEGKPLSSLQPFSFIARKEMVLKPFHFKYNFLQCCSI